MRGHWRRFGNTFPYMEYPDFRADVRENWRVASIQSTNNKAGKRMKSKPSEYRRQLKELEASDSYWANGVAEQFVAALERVMNVRGISKAELAKLAGVSAPYITRVMNGNANLSMQSMAKLAKALGSVVHVHIAPRGIAVDWVEEYRKSSRNRLAKVSEPAD